MNIRVDLNTPIFDGAEVVFRSPVDCSQVTGLVVYYKENENTASQEFVFADAHGNNVGDIDHLFAENVVVKVILDVTTSMAFVQNADTNAYLEGRFAEIEGKIGGGAVDGAVNYYSTTREEIDAIHDNINAEYIYGLYDALGLQGTTLAEVTYEENGEVKTVPIKEYVITTGEYCHSDNTVYGKAYSADENIKKPKYLIMSGVDGNERKTAFSTYRFIRDVLSGHNVPRAFREGAVIRVLPVANPVGFNKFSYEKPLGGNKSVNINHTFDWNRQEDEQPETQAITKWLTDNSDADLFIDFHNNGMTNENVAIIGTPNNDDTERVKKIALRGIDRVIPFWKTVIGYPSVLVPVMDEDGTTDDRISADVIFSYSVSGEVGGSAFCYAQNVLGIPSFVMETSSYYGDFDEWKANEKTYPAEPIAMGAEALGNILIELYSESCEVIDVSEVNDKLDALLGQVNSGFHSVSGVFNVPAGGMADPNNHNNLVAVALNCPPKPKMLVLQPDVNTLAAIKAQTKRYTLGLRAEYTSDTIEAGKDNNCLLTVWMGSNGVAQVGVISQSSEDRVAVQCYALLEGNYNWTAYYWNE